MKLPNLQFFAEAGLGFRDVVARFPLAIISAGVFVCFASFFHESYPLLVSSGVGIPLFILASFLGEALAVRNRSAKWVPSLAAIVFLASYGLSVHFRYSNALHDTFFVRLAMILLVVHLAIAFLPPLLIKADGHSTWEFNKSLLSRFIITAFYSAVFYIGTVLAIISIKELFGIPVDDDVFFDLWLFFAFFFNTALFLGGVPKLPELKTRSIDVPLWIQFLCKFILLPLVVLYFGILYAYLAKLAFAWGWPNGMVGYPVLILSVIGGLTALLMWPLSENKDGTTWAKTFWRWYFPSVLPLSLVLILALQKRISDYGFTELRYCGLALAIWLLAISLFYTIRRQATFQAIPISLCAIVLLCAYGPLSPRTVGQNSQWERLERLLATGGWLNEGKLKSNPHPIPSNDFDQLHSTITYLSSYYGLDQFEEWIEQFPEEEQQRLDWKEKNDRYYEMAGAITTFIGATPEQSSEEHRFLTLNLNPQSFYELAEPTRFYQTQLNHYNGGQKGFELKWGETSLVLKLVNDGQQLVVQNDLGQSLDEINLTDWIDVNDLELKPLEQYRARDAEELSITLDLGTDQGTLHAIINNAQFEYKDNTWRLNNGQLFLFVSAK